MANLYGPKIVTSGLVLCLDAGNSKSYPGTGTTWTDLSGNGYNGTLTNGPTFNSNNQGNIVFDGTNDFVVMANSSSVPVEGPGTIDIWANYSLITGSNRTLFSLVSGGNKAIQLGTRTGNANGLVWAYGGSSILSYSYPILDTISNWTLTFNGSNLTLYLNGLSNASTTTATNQTGSNGIIRLGTYDSVGNEPFNGKIYSSRLYNRVLSAAEVLQNYNATKGRFNL